MPTSRAKVDPSQSGTEWVCPGGEYGAAPGQKCNHFYLFIFAFFWPRHPEAGSNREYVVILACTEAITIAMLAPLQLIWLGAATGTVLVPGYGGMEGGGGGVSVRPNGR